MRKVFAARLVLLLFILMFGSSASPSHAFPACPITSCGYYYSMCEEYGGIFTYDQYWGWCDDGSGYLRGHGQTYCTVYGMTYEFGECADY